MELISLIDMKIWKNTQQSEFKYHYFNLTGKEEKMKYQRKLEKERMLSTRIWTGNPDVKIYVVA